MSDILLYAALKENGRLKDIKYGGGGVDIPLENWAQPLQPGDTPNFETLSAASTGATEEDLCPDFVKAWETHLKPLAAPRNNGIIVCDNSGQFRCGSNCAWTVPAGVTSALFQIWGPGGGSSANCCCGGAPFGPSGAFFMTELTVCPGEVFCLIAGCAFCCYATQTTPGGNSEDSCVMSCSNTNTCIKVESGYSCICSWNCDWAAAGGQVACNWQIPNNSGCGVAGCSGWNFCHDNNPMGVETPFLFSSCAWCENITDVKNFGYGIPSIWPRITIPETGLIDPAYTVSPPVFGFEEFTCGFDLVAGTTTCFGCNLRACLGFQQGPAFGGYASRVHGGCNACGGDAGGMGMICVSWNCD